MKIWIPILRFSEEQGCSEEVIFAALSETMKSGVFGMFHSSKAFVIQSAMFSPKKYLKLK